MLTTQVNEVIKELLCKGHTDMAARTLATTARVLGVLPIAADADMSQSKPVQVNW